LAVKALVDSLDPERPESACRESNLFVGRNFRLHPTLRNIVPDYLGVAVLPLFAYE
jgi:hypothetical protein